MLLEGIDDPEDRRSAPASEDEDAPPEIGVKTSSRNRRRPYTATLSMTPDMRAEIGRGAGRVGVGEPLVERDDTALDGKAEEEGEEGDE